MSESFPLLSLPTNGLGDVSITLSYGGNVCQAAVSENRDAQASFVGLGFNLGQDAIVADNATTYERWDDNYYLVDPSGGATQLIFSHSLGDSYESRVFRAGNGSTSRFYEHMNPLYPSPDSHKILSWTVTKEDGLTYTYSASAYALCWGKHYGVHTSSNGKRVPIRWNLSSVSRDTFPVQVKFTTLEETDSLKIPGGYNTEKYTRTTYPQTISVICGASQLSIATFFYSLRQDFQSTHRNANYEGYQARKLDSILVRGSDSSVVKRIRLGYSYLNSGRDSVFKKLLLRRITSTNGAGTDSLSPIRFDYYDTDSTPTFFGSLRRIYYPDGGKREFVYSTVPADSMVTTLHDKNTRETGFASNVQWYKYSRDAIVHKFRAEADTAWRYELTAWNGTWQKLIIPDIWDTDGNGDTGNFDVFGNVVYIYYQRINKVLRFQYLSGWWQRDTITAHFSSSNGMVGLTAGSNSFLLAHYPSGAHNTTFFADPKYYILDSTWKSLSLPNFAFYGGSRAVLNVQLGNDIHAIRFMNATSSAAVTNQDLTRVYYWSYDYDGDSLMYFLGQEGKQMQFLLGSNYGISGTGWGPEYDSTTTREYVYRKGSAFGSGTYTSNALRQFAPLASGCLDLTNRFNKFFPSDWSWHNIAARLEGWTRTGAEAPASWLDSSLSLSLHWTRDDKNQLFPSGGNRFLFYHQNYTEADRMETDLYDWNGNNWERVPFLSWQSANDNDIGLRGWLSGDLVVAIDEDERLIYVKRHKGNGDWTATVPIAGAESFHVFHDADHGIGHGNNPPPTCSSYDYYSSTPIACGRDNIVHNSIEAEVDSLGTVVEYTDARKLYRYLPLAGVWDTIGLSAYLPSCSAFFCKNYPLIHGLPDEVEPVAYQGRFFVPTPFYGLSAFQAYRNAYFGKPQVSVVSSVRTFPAGDSTANPIVVSYRYSGGILDEGSNSPRFCKSSQSLPYLLSDSATGADGWTISYFYNDLDSGAYTVPGVRLTDLDATSLGFAGAGYLLDGLPYISYDSSRGDGANVCFDSVVNSYRVVVDNSYGSSKIYRPQLVRTHTRSQKVPSDVAFSYDLYGRKTASRTWVQPGITKVDSITYAAFADSAAIGISMSPALEFSYLSDSIAASVQWLSRSHTEWENRLERKRTRLARNASDTNTYVTTYERISDGLDGFGNVMNVRGIDSDTSGAKYEPDGVRKLASIEKGFAKNVAVFDAETGFTQDSWQQIGNGAMSSTSTEQVCSGLKSLRIQDDAGSSSANSVLQRSFAGSDLKRKQYVISFWQRSSNTVSAKLTIQPSGTVLTVSSTGTGSWKKKTGMVDLSSYGTITSAVLKIETANLNSDVSYVDDIRFHPIDAIVSTFTYDPTTGLLLSSNDPTNEPVRFEYDSFQREVRTKDVKGRLLSEKTYYQSARDTLNSSAYKPSKPNYVFTKSFRNAGTDSIIGVTFFDGFGNPLQSRSLVRDGASIRTLVSGFAWNDARGRTKRAYKPWIDTSGSTGLMNYSDSATSLTEVTNYYNGRPYSETRYETTIKGRPLLSGGFAGARQIDSGHATSYGYAVNITGSDTTFDGWTYDQDGVLKVGRADSRGRWTKQISINRKVGNADSDSVTMITFPDIMHQCQSVKIDTGNGTSQILLNESWNNDLGFADSSWQVDYGKTYALYDNRGNPRFSRNEKQRAANQFTYVKYDRLGRKIEEGLINDSTKWSQAYASSRTFPSTTDTVNMTVTYRWFFDYYASGADTLFQPGKLVRVDNNTSNYYRHFYYFPDRDADSQVIKLPISGGTLKAIKREYNQDGSVNRLYVYPRLGQSGSYRVVQYQYDISGRPLALHKSVEEQQANDSLRYITYDYNADGSLRSSTIGASLRDTGTFPHNGSFRDSLQILNYVYDADGALTFINDPNAVSNSLNGGPSGSNHTDHFAEGLSYYTSTEGFYNGRALSTTSVNSVSGSSIEHYWKYSYNDFGWLTSANEGNQSGTTSLDEVYTYNLLGQRKTMKKGTANADTLYYSSTAGSSRVTRLSTMAGSINMWYDVLGNLTADSSRNLLLMKYDYRSLLNHVRMKAQFTTSLVDSMSFAYDENGNRIKKRYDYQYQDFCDTIHNPGGGEEFMMGGGGGGDSLSGGYSLEFDSIGGSSGFDSLGIPGGGGGESSFSSGGGGGQICTFQAFTEQFYLYDGGVLLATFDTKDSVIDLFINSPTGRVASYSQNKTNNLQYYLTDHLGSARVMMKGVPGQTYTVSQYYNLSPWGSTIESWGSYATPYKFTGKEHDQHGYFKAHYFGARYYDDRLGMFSSVDPAGQFVSAYVYGGNNPIIGVDPDGRWFLEALGLALTAVSFVVPGGSVLGQMILHAQIAISAVTVVQIGQNGGSFLQALQIIGTSAIGMSHIKGLTGAGKLGISLGTGYVVSADKKNYWKSALFAVGTTAASYVAASLHGQGAAWDKNFWGERKEASASSPSNGTADYDKQSEDRAINAEFASRSDVKTDEQIREKVAKTAEDYDGSTKWAYGARKDKFGPNLNKCNKFVGDITAEAGAPVLVKVQGKLRIPTAGELANVGVKKMNGWRVLEAGEVPQRGDLAAYKIPNCSDCTGHCGIVTSVDEDGFVTGMSAHYSKVGPDLQFNTDLTKNRIVTYRRLIGGK